MQNNNNWDTDYEWKVVLLLALGFGLVGLDRWILSSLWPTMIAELGFQPGTVGQLAGLTGITWGIFAIFSGRLADKIGHRKILIAAIILFSLMGGFTGMIQTMVMLVAIRSIMGAAEGSFTAPSFTAVAVASKPSRRGLNQGLQQCGFALVGFALAPIVATQLLEAGFSWRIIFWIAAVPGFIVAAFLIKVLKEPQDTMGAAELGVAQEEHKDVAWLNVFKSSNIIVCMVMLMCAMACVFVLGALVPVYLQVVLELTPGQMGTVASAVGFGGFFGQFGWPGLSDKLGRKPVCTIGFIGATICVWWFFQTGASVGALFVPLFLTAFFCLGNVALITGPISTESAPTGLVAASIGIVVGTGEIFGGGVAPAIAGSVANNLGLPSIVWVPLIGVALGIVVSLFLKETAPVKIISNATPAIDESGPVA
jgi:MFS family permease